MPLTTIQKSVAKLLSQNRTENSYLAGGAALHFRPNSKRYSNDLDFFHDSEKRVSEAFQKDFELLKSSSYNCEIEMNQPGHIRAVVSRVSQSKDIESTKIEWAHDSAWRFLPVVYVEDLGFVLHPIDLATNKTLALAGRDEARDFLDILHLDSEVLPLGALIWAACGKDPGFTPHSLFSLIQRRGKYRPEDFSRLHLSKPIELTELKQTWLSMLEHAKEFIDSRPSEEIGCLYYSNTAAKFVAPEPSQDLTAAGIYLHFGRPGGILPEIVS